MEIGEFRQRVHALLTEPETADLLDEEWWERLGDLLDQVYAARARAKRERRRVAAVNTMPDKQRDVVRCPVTWNPGVWPFTTRCVWKAGHEGLKHVDRNDNAYTETVEQHRFSFEGSTTQLADHLVTEHGLYRATVLRWRDGLTSGDWVALDNIHRAAHERGV